jgi:hypothetical protein
MRPMSDDLEPLLGQPTVFAKRRFPHYPSASASLSRASTKPKEQGNTERGETAPPRRAGSSRQAGRPAAGKAICEMRVAHGALRMTTVFPRVRSANRPRMTGPAAQTNRMPAAAPSWRQCCEIMRPMEPSCRVTPSPSSRVARSARPAGFARQEPFTRPHHSDRESVSSILCLEQLARGETQSENS